MRRGRQWYDQDLTLEQLGALREMAWGLAPA
jgi:hypothetical protein